MRSFAEYTLTFVNIVIMSLSAWWFYKTWKANRTLSYEITLVCTPEGYRRILAHCELTNMTQTKYFNHALDLIADDLELVRGDEVKVV